MAWTITIAPSGSTVSSRRDGDLEVEVAGERLLLLNQRAVLWPSRRCLIASDLHWGQTAAFRAASIPGPRDSAFADLDRLADVLARTGASRLILLGDLIHKRGGRNGRLLEAFSDWRKRHRALDIFLVQARRRRPGQIPEEWRIHRVFGPWFWKPFAFRHVPAPTGGAYTLAGHLHPTVDQGKKRVPCYLFGSQVAILPAFGSFNGSMLVEPAPTDQVFTVDERGVGF